MLKEVNDLLTQRQQQILNLIVQLYGEKEEPIGSNTLLQQSVLNVSPATVRNDMLLLEKLGFLQKAHTSSGRIPSKEGYRYYVQTLIGHPNSLPEWTSKDDLNAFSKLFLARHKDVLHKAKVAADTLVTLTGYTVFVLSQQTQTHLVEEFKLIHMSDYQVIAVLLTNKGIVESQMFEMTYATSKDIVAKISNIINDEIQGKSLEEALQKLKLTVPLMIQRIAAYQIDFSDLIQKTINHMKVERYYVSGKNNLFDYLDVQHSSQTFKEVFNLFDGAPEFIEFLERQQMGVQVTFGSDIMRGGLSKVSLVTNVCHIEHQKVLIGLLGPSIMPYERIIGLMELLTEQLSTQ